MNEQLPGTKLKTVGAVNRLQPRVTRAYAYGRAENPDAHPHPYEVGVVILDANGVAWQRDIDNLVSEYFEVERGQTWWWKVGSSDDGLTSRDIPLPATLLTDGVVTRP